MQSASAAAGPRAVKLSRARLDDRQRAFSRRRIGAPCERQTIGRTLVDQAAAVGVERGAAVRRGAAAFAVSAALALGGPGRDFVGDRLRPRRRDRQPHVAAVRAAGVALHVVAVARLDAREERVDLRGQLGVARHPAECMTRLRAPAMDLNDIVVFTKVVETKSFTGAADALGLPKSTVSRKLAQLEERLGVRLVQRTTRKLALTEIGEAYYERCSRIVADVARGRAARHRHAVDAARPPARDRVGRFLDALPRRDRRRLPRASTPTSTSSSRRPTASST